MDESHVTTHLNTFGSNMLLTLKFKNFEDVALTKVNSFLFVKGHACIIYL
jgi:hypothetical protein